MPGGLSAPCPQTLTGSFSSIGKVCFYLRAWKFLSLALGPPDLYDLSENVGFSERLPHLLIQSTPTLSLAKVSSVILLKALAPCGVILYHLLVPVPPSWSAGFESEGPGPLLPQGSQAALLMAGAQELVWNYPHRPSARCCCCRSGGGHVGLTSQTGRDRAAEQCRDA